MGLRLKIVSQHRQALGGRAEKSFGIGGGTIGRSLESDWVLSDSKRFVSSRHASIDFRSGTYYIVDTSTNGVYVNGSTEPVGRGKPQRLFNGDRLRIGEYEMVVHLDDNFESTTTYTEEEHVDPVDAAQRVQPPDPTGRDLVDAFEITGVGIEEIVGEDADAYVYKKAAEQRAAALRLEDESSQVKVKAKAKRKAKAKTKPAAEPVAPPTPAPELDPEPLEAPDSTPASAGVGAGPQAQRSVSGRTLEPFFRGAGLKLRSLNEQQALLLLHLLGQLVRELIVGLQENLYVRAEHKNLVRQPHTTIQSRSNNPLKFSAGTEEALNNLLFREADEYISAVDAVRQCFQDIRGHQQTLVAAFMNGLRDYVARLDPQEIESKLSKKPSTLLGAANKLKYWDSYRELYEVVTQRSPGQFPQAFLDDLAQAYELEIERHGGKLDKSKAQAS
jgi:type VI secretion system FHA domain protein